MTRSSPGVKRMAAVIDFMADHPDQAFALTDLVRALRLSRATCHALLAGLVEVGYLYRTSDKTYVLGPALARIGRLAADHFSPLQIAQPEMRALADEYDVICSAFYLDGDHVVVRDRAASISHVGFSIPKDARLKLRAPFCASFRLSPADADAWLEREQPAPSAEQRQALHDGVEFVTAHGFLAMVRNPATGSAGMAPEQVFGSDNRDFPVTLLTTVDPDAIYDLSSITAPVVGARGKVEFVMGLMGFNRMTTGADVLAAGRTLRDACSRIGRFLA